MLGEPYASASDIIIKRQVLSKSTIKLDGDREGGNCIVGESQAATDRKGTFNLLFVASIPSYPTQIILKMTTRK